MWFQTNVGSSFSCNLSQPQVVTNMSQGMGLSVDFTMSRWEAFGISKTGHFSKGLITVLYKICLF